MKKDNLNEELQFENEILKLKLTAEYGAYSSACKGLTPEQENEFLKDMLAFNEQKKNCRKLTMHEFVGKPGYVHAWMLNDAQLHEKLEELLDLFYDNGIDIKFNYLSDEREKYRFITEDLFPEVIDDIRTKKFRMVVFYEDYHPNKTEDLKTFARLMLAQFFIHGSEDFSPNKEFALDKSAKSKNISDLIKTCSAFRDSYSFLEVKSISFTRHEETDARFVFDFVVHYSARPEDSGELLKLSAAGRIGFDDDGIFHFSMPGILPQDHNKKC